MLSSTKSRTFLKDQLATDNHGPQGCETVLLSNANKKGTKSMVL